MKKSQYSYALGEILIVIVGISIAFSLNRCSETSKNNALRKQYLTNLKNDIEADRSLLSTNLSEVKTKLKLSNEILPVLRTDSDQKMEAIGKLFSIASISNFTAKDVTFQTLINSGDLALLQDFNLKTALQAHYSSYNEMLKDYERQENIHKEYLGKYLIENADYDAIRNGAFGLSNEKLLKNIVQSMSGSFRFKIDAINKGIKSCDSVIAILDKALKN